MSFYIKQKEELNKFKSEIDLTEFIENRANNFEFKASRSSSNSFCYEDGNSRIAVFKKQGVWWFKDFKAPIGVRGKGTIIDFVQDYLKWDFKDIRKELRNYMNLNPIQKPNYNTIQNVLNNKTGKKKLPENYFATRKLAYTKYLNDRGIKNDTIFSKTFFDSVRQKDIIKESGQKYFSTVFPMYKNISGGIVGLEQSNNLYNRSFPGSNKQEGFWKSNVIKENPSIFIVESPIDALSHYQLHNLNNKDNLLYVSSLGELSEKRLKVLNNYLVPREFKIKKIILGNDNDLGGVRFNINIIGNVHLQDTVKDLSFFIASDKHIAKMKVTSTDLSKLKEVETRISYMANKEMDLTSNYDLQYRNFKYSEKDGKNVFSFIMNNRLKVLKPLEDVVKEFKNSPLIFERPISKDFGQDLENKLGIKREYKVIGKYSTGEDKLMKVWNRSKPLDKGLSLGKGI